MLPRLIIVFLLCGAVAGLAADSMSRSFDRTVTLTPAPIIVTVSFTNQGTAGLRGFYYADQIPSALEVTPLSVTVAGQRLTNYTFEVGLDGDVYPGCTPYRWVLERPGDFAETNPIPPQANAQIVYAIRATESGSLVLQHFDWIGCDSVATNGVFGVSEPGDQQTVSFLTSPQLTITNNKASLAIGTAAGETYVIEYKHDLPATDWLSLTTLEGTGSIVVWEDPAPLLTRRFYRVRSP